MAQHTTARLYATKDTHVITRYPTQNFHNAAYTNIGKAGSEQAVGLFAFDTNHGITTGANIISAKFYFTIDYASTNGTYTFTVRPCSGTWSETGVTYNSIPTTTDTVDTVLVSSATRYVDVTNTVKKMLDGTYSLANGLYITCADEDSRKRLMQRTASDVNQRPYLVITWADPISVPVPNSTSYNLGDTLYLTLDGAGDERTHNITYKIGNTVVRTQTGVVQSDNYTLPLDLANYITTSDTATMTITAETVMNGTVQGSSSTSVRLVVPSSIVPTISGIAVAESASNWPTALAGKWVQAKSIPKVTITASGAYGSTISKYSTNVLGKAYSGNPVAVDSPNTSGTVSIDVTVTDSRGRTATSSITISVVAYSVPRITAFRVSRCLADGTYADDGEYAKFTAEASVSSLDELNTSTAQVSYKTSSGGTWTVSNTYSNYGLTFSQTNAVLSAGEIFDEITAYTIALQINDVFGASYAYATLPTRTIVWDVSSSGKSIGFGVGAGSDGTMPLGLALAPTSETLQQTQENLTAVTAITATTDILALGRGLYFLDGNSSTDYGFPAVTWSPSIEVSGPINGGSANDGYAYGHWTVWVRGFDGQQWINRRKWDAWTGWKQLLDTGGGTIDGALTVGGMLTLKDNLASTPLNEWQGILLNYNGGQASLQGAGWAATLQSKISDDNRRYIMLHNSSSRPQRRYCLDVWDVVNGVHTGYSVPVQTDWTQLTPADGVTTPGEYGNGVLRYRAEGKHVYVAGSINAAWDGSSNKLIATLPAGYRPANGNSYFLQVRGGQNISRVCIKTTGEMNIEWVKNLSGGSNNTGSGWLDLNMDFWID